MPLIFTEIKEKVIIAPTLLKQPQEERQTIVHCNVFSLYGTLVRIWKSTFLIDRHTGKKYKLLTALNIGFYPVWTKAEPGIYEFTLIFEGLDKDFKVFDLHEIIPQEGGFYVPGISRNQTDVYTVRVS